MDSASGMALKVGTARRPTLTVPSFDTLHNKLRLAALGRQHVAHLAGERTRTVDHHVNLAVEGDRGGALGNVAAQAEERIGVLTA